MKKLLIGSLAVALSLSAISILAQQNTMDDMKDMPTKPTASDQESVHATKGRVIKVDISTGVVTLAHDPVQSLNLPAMTMGFSVRDERLFDKLDVGSTVDFEFTRTDEGYVITAVK